MNLPNVSPKSAENNEVKPTYTLQRGGEIIVPPQCVKTRLLEAMKEKEAEGKCMISRISEPLSYGSSARTAHRWSGGPVFDSEKDGVVGTH